MEDFYSSEIAGNQNNGSKSPDNTDFYSKEVAQQQETVPSVTPWKTSGEASNQENIPSDALSGMPAVAVEAGRGLEKGTGQLVSDVGLLLNTVSGGNLPQVQQFGNQLIQKAKDIPVTNLPGFVKGAANLVGEAAPMLATFGGGEALGLAKLGEGGIKLLSAASKSERVAGYLNKVVRPMGQATLFGTVNAIDTASTLPENMDFNQKVNAIVDSGKTGFIAGAVFTPIMDKGLDVLRNQGENAFNAFMVGMTGSPKAAEDSLNLARKQGSYDRIMIDPSKPIDQRISFIPTMAKELSPSEREIAHDRIIESQESQISGIRESYQTAQRTLEDNISESNHKFDLAQEQMKNQLNDTFNKEKDKQVSQAETLISQNGQKAAANLDVLENANTQQLNGIASTLDNHINNTVDLLTANRDMLLASVAKNDPAGGFDINGMVGKIKGWLKSNYNVDLVKVPKQVSVGGTISDEANAAGRAKFNELMKGQGFGGEEVWTAKAGNTAGVLPPDIAKTIKFLTGDNGYLSRLEELGKTNGGKISLDMLSQDSRLIKSMAYDSETGIINSGLAQLDATIRPNKLVGDIAKENDSGMWVGSKDSLSYLKESAMHDAAISDLLEKAKTVRSEFIGNKEFTGNMTTKVKALLSNKEGYESLRKFEDSLNLAPDSKIRLTESFKDYSKNIDGINASRKQLKESMGREISARKSEIEDSLNNQKREEIKIRSDSRYKEKEKIIQQKRDLADQKRADLDKAIDFKKQLSDKIELENKNRLQALNEISGLGSYSTALGKLQRGALLGSVFHPTPIGLALSAALTPKTAISGSRTLKKFMMSDIGKSIGRNINTGVTNKYSQRLLIGNLLESNRNKK